MRKSKKSFKSVEESGSQIAEDQTSLNSTGSEPPAQDSCSTPAACTKRGKSIAKATGSAVTPYQIKTRRTMTRRSPNNNLARTELSKVEAQNDRFPVPAETKAPNDGSQVLAQSNYLQVSTPVCVKSRKSQLPVRSRAAPPAQNISGQADSDPPVKSQKSQGPVRGPSLSEAEAAPAQNLPIEAHSAPPAIGRPSSPVRLELRRSQRLARFRPAPSPSEAARAQSPSVQANTASPVKSQKSQRPVRLRGPSLSEHEAAQAQNLLIHGDITPVIEHPSSPVGAKSRTPQPPVRFPPAPAQNISVQADTAPPVKSWKSPQPIRFQLPSLSEDEATPAQNLPIQVNTNPPHIELPSSPASYNYGSTVDYIRYEDPRKLYKIRKAPCFCCKRRLSYAPEGPYVKPELRPEVSVLPCGHVFHTFCLMNVTHEDQGIDPPCIPCIIGDS